MRKISLNEKKRSFWAGGLSTWLIIVTSIIIMVLMAWSTCSNILKVIE